MQGTVKWFDSTKGYGFITTENNEDIFVHHTDIDSEGFKTLNENDSVVFSTKKGPKGTQAANVTIAK